MYLLDQATILRVEGTIVPVFQVTLKVFEVLIDVVCSLFGNIQLPEDSIYSARDLGCC